MLLKTVATPIQGLHPARLKLITFMVGTSSSGEARRKWMVVPITDLQTLKIYPKRQLDNCNFDRKGKVLY